MVGSRAGLCTRSLYAKEEHGTVRGYKFDIQLTRYLTIGLDGILFLTHGEHLRNRPDAASPVNASPSAPRCLFFSQSVPCSADGKTRYGSMAEGVGWSLSL